MGGTVLNWTTPTPKKQEMEKDRQDGNSGEKKENQKDNKRREQWENSGERERGKEEGWG